MYGRSAGWLRLSARCLFLVVFTSFAAPSAVLGQFTPPRGPDDLGDTPTPAFAPDRVIVKLTPDAAMGVMGRGGKRVPPGLAKAMEKANAKWVEPLFADLWPGHGKGPIHAADEARSIHARFPGRAARAPWNTPVPDLENILVLTLEEGADVYAAVAELKQDPDVVYAEPDRLVHTFATPNDPYFSSTGSWGQPYADMWGLYKINAPAAWDITTGSDSVVIAVVDTGLDYNHPDIAGRVWTNSGEIPGNGIDDDGNGFIDDVRGWDFAYGDNDPMDGYGHGTHVSGTIAAATNNGLGVAGITWAGKILPVKGLDDSGSGYDSTLALAMRYAADNGADVMNNSWGGSGVSQTIQDAVDYAYALGCIVVAAAGNSNSDAKYFSPPGFRMSSALPPQIPMM